MKASIQDFYQLSHNKRDKIQAEGEIKRYNSSPVKKINPLYKKYNSKIAFSNIFCITQSSMVKKINLIRHEFYAAEKLQQPENPRKTKMLRFKKCGMFQEIEELPISTSWRGQKNCPVQPGLEHLNN